jgi:MFS family permease
MFVIIEVLLNTVNPNETAANSDPVAILLLTDCRNDGATTEGRKVFIVSAIDKPIVEAKARSQPLPGARQALILLLVINLFNYIDRQVLAALEHPIENTLFPRSGENADKDSTSTDPYVKAKMGALQTAFMVSYMVLAPIFGWLADRMSRWFLIGVGVILWSLASAGSGWNWHADLSIAYSLLLVTRCFVGVGEAAYGPAAPTIISDLYPVKVRGQVIAWFYAAIPVGSALGYVLAGVVTKLTGDWRYAFYCVLPPGIALGIWSFLMRDPPRGQADLGGESAKGRPRLKDIAVLWQTPSYLLVTAGMTAMTFALGGLAFWIPSYLIDTKQADKDFVNVYFGGIVVVSGLVATLLGGMLGDRLRARFPGSYFLVSGLSMIIGFPMVLGVIWAPYPWYWAFVFIACFCLFFNTGPTNTVLANVTHPSVRSSAFAINIFIIHALGDAISPTVIGLIAGFASMEVGFVSVSLAILIGGILWLWGTRYLARDTELAPTRLDV